VKQVVRIAAWQKARNLPADGFATVSLLERIMQERSAPQ
jgi:hypothetical protein